MRGTQVHSAAEAQRFAEGASRRAKNRARSASHESPGWGAGEGLEADVLGPALGSGAPGVSTAAEYAVVVAASGGRVTTKDAVSGLVEQDAAARRALPNRALKV